MEKRMIIGYVLFFILLILSIFEYINYSLFFMVIVIYIAINTILNSYDDTSENNKNRVTLLGILLVIFSYSHFSSQTENYQRVKQAMNECYKFSNDSSLCDKIYSILEPEPEDISK
ncbi:hypothetical protein Q6A87_08600 [Aliarcobacter skirrowii]|uniref:hypothetical protein n=1 Tax=Aliarcobacter TaxID=2321111 RepID=UPI0021B5A093|nr:MULTISPECIES: hypothetical protein [Aliarcobacter]MCT7509268.1 hypothetical protein [Aliarcobacter cryaerophilus]MDX4067907.1 hypothetical protein [Aliarcobacter skirrowii]